MKNVKPVKNICIFNKKFIIIFPPKLMPLDTGLESVGEIGSTEMPKIFPIFI